MQYFMENLSSNDTFFGSYLTIYTEFQTDKNSNFWNILKGLILDVLDFRELGLDSGNFKINVIRPHK